MTERPLESNFNCLTHNLSIGKDVACIDLGVGKGKSAINPFYIIMSYVGLQVYGILYTLHRRVVCRAAFLIGVLAIMVVLCPRRN